MPGQPTPERKHHIDARRSKAVELKLAGWTLHDIGHYLHADPAHNSRGISVPQGYGWDAYTAGNPPPKRSRLTDIVCQDIRRALRERATKLDDDVDTLRGIQVNRYENLLRTVLQEVTEVLDDQPHTGDEDEKAAERAAERRYRLRDQALRILARLDTVQGLARPVRTEHSGPGGGPIPVQHVSLAELEALIDAAGDPDPDTDSDDTAGPGEEQDTDVSEDG